jgi:hypothetical protein
MIRHPLLASFLVTEKERGTKRRERERKKEIGKNQDLKGVASRPISSHGGAGLVSFHHYAGPSTKP